MPYKIIPLASGKYKLINSITGRVHSYHSSKKNVQAQLRLLNALDNGLKLKKK